MVFVSVSICVHMCIEDQETTKVAECTHDEQPTTHETGDGHQNTEYSICILKGIQSTHLHAHTHIA